MLVLGACAPAATPAPVATEAPAAKPVHIAFFVPWTEDIWYVVAIQGAQARAAELGIQLDVYDGANKVETQIQQFDTALSSNPDAIVLSSVDPATMIPSIEKAADAGIKTVVYDRPIYATTKLDALLVLDTANMGQMQGQAIVDLPDGEEWLRQGQGHPCLRRPGRHVGYRHQRRLGSLHGAVSRYHDPAGHVRRLGARRRFGECRAAVDANPDVDAIVMDSDWLASGIITYLTSNYDPVGGANHIFVIGDGGMPEGLQYIRDGYMDMTINNPVPDFLGRGDRGGLQAGQR